ncbi:MAG: NADPH-dependent glutamate synthase [Polyangiaceae bacterium]|nr:NADPH-dependent glutamate synthase [Polyangiaceae bacterium]
MRISRATMPEQDASERRSNFHEVALGLTAELAKQEAARCLECKDPTCIDGCPVRIDIKKMCQLVCDGKLEEAAALVREQNVLPAITGRVCPQEDQCEKVCLVAKSGKFRPVAIGFIERFLADFERESGCLKQPTRKPSTGKKVAVVGSGPAGLTVAGDLAQLGHAVTVFEALHELGGVLVYGIPEFRLPKAIVKQDIEALTELGVELVTDVVVGRTVTIDELMEKEGYSAVFVATGAGLPRFMGIPGEDLNGVYSANEFLTRVNLMRAYAFPEYDEPIFDCRGKNIATFGGGNTAMDAARTALRLGAGNSYLIYRRSEHEMPARIDEIHHAEEEGVQFITLTNPTAFLGDGKGWLTGVRLQKMGLGEPDSSGRRRPVPIEGSEYEIPVDAAVVAVGTSANPIIGQTTPDLRLNRWGYIEVNPETMRTSKRGVFAGGDIVTGGATVILAMGAGRVAAKSMHEYLTTGDW